jgi:hypothetical protein
LVVCIYLDFLSLNSLRFGKFWSLGVAGPKERENCTMLAILRTFIHHFNIANTY